MPVWHEKTRALRESGALAVVGITEEQHPDRCRLFAQWHGIDWPILWDPFNLTASAAVPLVLAVDERGVVRPGRLDPRRFEEQVAEGFLRDAPPDGEPAERPRPYDDFGPDLVGPARLAADDVVLRPEQALSRLLFYDHVHDEPLPAAELDHSIASLELTAASARAEPADHFRMGVALRLRYDSPYHRPQDFQRSLDAWTVALLANPGQYIWRRRIQQWGPRLDKPYPFYDWIDTARAEIAARGEEPVPVRVPLTGAEIADKTNRIPVSEGEDVHPDPDGGVPRDTSDLVTAEVAVAPHTGIAASRVREPVGTSRVHVVLRPDPERDVHWSNDAGPTVVWIDLPEGWNVRHNLHVLPVPEGAEGSDEVRRLDFEVRPPVGPPSVGSVRGTAFYYVCEGGSGECSYLARDFEAPIPAGGVPPAPGVPGGREDR